MESNLGHGDRRPRVVVVGAGFAGLWAVKALRRAPVQIELVDRNNFHTFFPLLYQVAAAELAPGDIAHPIRKIIRRQANVSFTLATVEAVDLEAGVVSTDVGEIEYDFLILATGSTTSYFGVDGAADHSFGLRTLDDAVRLRDHVLRTFEAAQRVHGSARQRAMAFVIVGGGPTGVEFSGALQELINGPLEKDHPELDVAAARVVLVEAGDQLLNVYPRRLSRYARRRLEKMGVEVRLGASVVAVAADSVSFADGSQLATDTVVWTAGVGGPEELGSWGIATRAARRASVSADLSLDGAGRVYVVGDGSLPSETSAPMVAQNATQQGTLAAENILATLSGNPRADYRYRDLGNMAVIGRNSAVVHLFGKLGFKGYLAWVMWLSLHLAKLIGFRNRIAALLSWSGDYIFRDRVARLITTRDDS